VTPHALVLNCGSSSIKYQVIAPDTEKPVMAGQRERIRDHRHALQEIFTELEAHHSSQLSQIGVVGHRVVQGGSEFTAPTLITKEVVRQITLLSTLAPLHNPANIAGIEAAQEIFPQIPHVAVFDTAFHHTLSRAASTYAIDQRVAEEHEVRRYGFHGTSHAFVSRATATAMNREVHELSTIVLHLGNGASACAVQGGRSIDTSMGLTPLEGLVMGTRSGDIDPAIVFHLHRATGMDVSEIDSFLNSRSGLLGLSGYSDMRDVLDARMRGDDNADLAFDVYTRRIRGYIGTYYAHLGRLDAIAFTAGIGENSPEVRAASLAGLEVFGIMINASLNEAGDGRFTVPTRISTEDSPVEVWVIPTHEEREIASQALAAIAHGTA